METNRYNRQQLIENWDQERLTKARIAIIGSSQLANFTAATLAALGIGDIELYDDAKVEGNSYEGFLLFQARQGESKMQALEKVLREMNPQSRIKGVNLRIEKNSLISLIGKPNVIIDVTNSCSSKETVLSYAKTKSIPVISASADDVRTEMHVVNPGEEYERAMLREYAGIAQGAVTSEIMAGLLTEEIRKLLMPMNDEKLVKTLAYSNAAGRRFSKDLEEEVGYSDLSNKKVLIIGAGALGNFVGLGMALSGIGKLDILDFDEVDSTNLNRQILFYDTVGRKKAEALSEKLSCIAPKAKIKGIVGKLNEKSTFVRDGNYDLIMDCVDSFSVRAIINYFAIRNNLSLISGGTNPSSGQVAVYIPRISACIDCKLGVEQALAKAMAATSCKYAPDPSVIMTNEIIGGLMVAEARKVLDAKYGKPVTRVLKYDSKAPSRAGLIGIDGPCSCEKPTVKEWLEQVASKYKEGEK